MTKKYDIDTIIDAVTLADMSDIWGVESFTDKVIDMLPRAAFYSALAEYIENEFERECSPLDFENEDHNFGILCTSHYLNDDTEIDMQLTYNIDTETYNFYYGAAVFGDLSAPDCSYKCDIETVTDDLLKRDFYEMLVDKLELLIDDGMEV